MFTYQEMEEERKPKRKEKSDREEKRRKGGKMPEKLRQCFIERVA